MRIPLSMSSLLFAGLVSAQTPSIPLPSAPNEVDTLADKATDPTASLMSFTFQSGYIGGYYGDAPAFDGEGWQAQFKAAIPFELAEIPNLFRLALPFQFSGLGPEGIGSVGLLDVMLLDQSWGRAIFGPQMSIDTTGDLPDAVLGGFVLGGVAPVTKKLRLGLITQNLFGNDTAVSQVQPVIAYQLGHGWSLSLGDAQFTYDWQAGQWTNLPVGFQVGKVTKLGKQPIRFFVNPQYNLQERDGLNEWSVTAGFVLLVPSF